MDIEEYRKSLEAEAEREGVGAGSVSDSEIDATVALAGDSSKPVDERVAALRSLGGPARTRKPLLDLLFRILKDRQQPAVLRRAALVTLLLLRFNSPLLIESNAELVNTLRSAIDDPDDDVRMGVLEALAQRKDDVAQKRLVDSLTGKGPVLLPPQKAIQLLGYDIHSNHYPMLRGMVERSNDDEVKREAVRVLASDPDSEDLLRKIFRDKTTTGSVRRASARALISLAPHQFVKDATNVVLDATDDDQVRAAALTALTHLDNVDGSALAAAVDKVEGSAKSEPLRNAVANFRTKQRAK